MIPPQLHQPSIPESQGAEWKRPAVASGHLPELDGLRAVAILLVLCFHLHVSGFSLGWSGVNLFFVISGFLITRILLSTIDRPYYFRNFYARRTLRIFPIYYLIVGIYTLALWLRRDQHDLRAMPFYFAYVQTIPQLMTSFTVAPRLNHTWTLAIEEQFYLFWPLVVFLFARRGFYLVLGLTFSIAIMTRYISLYIDRPYLLFGWLPAQLDALAAGALVAYAAQRTERQVFLNYAWSAVLVGTVSIFVIVGLCGPAAYWFPAVWPRQHTSPFLLLAMSIAFGGFVGLCAGASLPLRWLRIKPLARIGKISYGLYLYHPFAYWAVERTITRLRFIRSMSVSETTTHLAIALLELGMSYGLAEISWFLIENPLNRLKSQVTRTDSTTQSDGATCLIPAHHPM